MSFLVASGHVQVDANTRDAKDKIQDLVRSMGGISPTAQAAANALKDLGKRATTAGQSLGRLGDRAQEAERALAGLRAVAGDIRVKAELHDDTAGGVASVQAAIQALRAQSPVDLEVHFTGDTGEITASAAAMHSLRDNARNAGQSLTTLTVQSAAATVALNELRDAAQDASRALRTLRGRVAATAEAMRDLRDSTARASRALLTAANRADSTGDRFNTLADRSRTLRSDMDDLDGSLRRVGGSMGALRPRLGGLSSSAGGASMNTRRLIVAAIGLGTALIPVGAALVPIVAGTAAATAGVTAFGLAIGRQVAAMSQAAQAEKKYQDAIEKHGGAGSKEAAEAARELQAALADMPAATQEAAAGLVLFKEEYKAWSDSLADDTMPVLTHSMAAFSDLLPRMSPLVRGTAEQLDRLVAVAAGGMQTAGFERFMDKLAGWSSGALARATLGMVKFSQALDTGEVSSDVDEFMDYVRANGPLVADTLGNLVEAATKLIVAASDMGVSVLGVVNAFAKLVNAIPTSTLSTILQLYAGFKLLSVGMAGVSAVATSGAIARLGAYFALMRTAGVGTTLRATAASMTTMQKAGAALGVLGVVAFGINELAEEARGAPPDIDRLTNSLKTLAASGKWSGELKATFGDMDGFVAKINQIKQGTRDLDIAKPFMDMAPGGMIVEKVAGKVDDLVNGTKSLGAVKDDVKSFDAAFAAMASSGHAGVAADEFKKFETALKGAGYSTKEINQLFPEYKSAVAGLKAEQQLAAQGMGIFGQQAQETGRKLDAQKASADGLRASLLALNDVNRSAYDAQIAFEAGIDALTASFKEHGATLNLDTAAGQANGKAMSDAAKGHDEMVASGLAAGESLASMTTKSDKLRSTMMRLATDAFGGNKKAAEEYVNKLLGIPSEVKTLIKAERAEAITGLKAVQAEIQRTPGAKSIKVDTLNAAAIKALEAVGYKTRTLEDGRTEVFTKNGQAIGSIGAVRKALDNLNGKTARTYTEHSIHYKYTAGKRPDGATFMGASGRLARGGRVPRYAGGGDVQAFPAGGYIDGPGSSTSDSILAMMGSGAAAMVSNTEYVMRSAAVKKYGVPLMDAINSGQLRLPGFAKGGKLSAKQKAQIKAEQEARNAARGDLTISHFGKMAGYKTTEFAGDMARPDSLNDLVGTLNGWRNKIKAATHGSTESRLLKQLDSSGKALLANEKKLAGVNKALESAKGKLDDLKGKFDQLKTSVSSSLVSFGNITKIGKYGTSPETLIKQLQSDTSRTTQFASMLDQLKGKGLNATAIADIAQAGVTGGGMATAQSLLNATPEQIKQINELQAQLQKSADKAGTVTADAMYGAGIKAAEGIVKGLTAQQDKIEAAMMAIAKSMEKSIKAALGIKSPSKLMEPIGDFAFQGIERGWVKRAAAGNTLLGGNTAGLRVRPALLSGASSAAAPAAAPTVNLTATFNTMTLPSAAERKVFAQAMAKDINDALLTYQKGRRR